VLKPKGPTLAYLILYNAVSAGLWAYFGYRFLMAWHKAGWTLSGPFTATIHLLCMVQTVAILEIFHAVGGIVKSEVMSTTMQIFSRLLVSWLAGYYLRAGEQWGYVAISVAWTISDFTRYLYYIANLVGCCPKMLTWTRYSLFLVLYPLGTIGEMSMLMVAGQVLALLESKYRYALLGLLAIYPFGFLFMYQHMLKQRAKYLGGL
jgi:very-long-chain (3R)-3-hydroxyacyl-CoA dehydratase